MALSTHVMEKTVIGIHVLTNNLVQPYILIVSLPISYYYWNPSLRNPLS